MNRQNPIFRFARGGDGLSRRQMVQRLIGTAGGGAALVTLGPLANARDAQPAPGDRQAQQQGATPGPAEASWSPAFLDPHQNETLIVLGERIIPGSGRAQVNRMIDLLLTADSQQSQRRFLESLSAFDGEAIARYRKPYQDLTEEQQNAILTAASTAESGRKDAGDDQEAPSTPPSSFPATSASQSALTLRDHFENIKDWVSRSYYSSEVGLRDLGWTGRLAWDHFPGCEHPDGHA